MLERLKQLEQLRGAEARNEAASRGFHQRVMAVKQWQQVRLRRSYADLAASDRFAAAVAFFLDELYGTKDSAIRDRDLIRMYPTMQRLLPAFAFKVVESALELDVLAEEFDQAVAAALGKATLTEASYLTAFRQVGRHADRLHQVVKKPMIYTALKMLHRPARLAGLGEMQQFLEAGFTAFRKMKGADEFLRVIAERETLLINRIFDQHPRPFAVVDEWEQLAGKAAGRGTVSAG